MDITLYNMDSEPLKLEKHLSNGDDFEGVLREGTSITNPVIRFVGTSDLTEYNYAHIPSFGRYYYITDCVSVRDGLWDISMKCDVLMSFADSIKQSSAVIDRSSNEMPVGSPYLENDGNVVLVKRKTDIIEFSSGFDTDGEFILITAGGFAT